MARNDLNYRLLKQLPRPLAHLYKRTYTAPGATHRHQAALDLWEATTELLAIGCLDELAARGSDLRPAFEQLGLQLKPGVGHWRGCLRESLATLASLAPDEKDPFAALDKTFRTDDDRELQKTSQLFQEVIETLPAVAATAGDFSIGGLFDVLVEYRNAVYHRKLSTQREEAMSLSLREGLAEVLLRIDPLAGRHLVHVLNARKCWSGEFQIEYKPLRGADDVPVKTFALPLNFTGKEPLSDHLYWVHDALGDGELEDISHWRIATPWAICRRDDVYLFAGLYGKRKSSARIQYVCHGSASCEEAYTRESAALWRPAFADLIFKTADTNPDGPAPPPEPINKPGSSGRNPGAAPKSGSHPVPLPARIGEYQILSQIGKGGMGRVFRAWQRHLEREVALKELLAPDQDKDHERFEREVQALARIDHPNVVKVHHSAEENGKFYFTMDLIEGTNLAGVYRSLLGKPPSSVSPDDWANAVSTACANARKSETWRSKRREDALDPAASASNSTGAAACEPPASDRGSTSGYSQSGKKEEYLHEVVDLIRQVAEGVHAMHLKGVIHRDVKPGNIRVTPDRKRAVLVDLGLVKIADENSRDASSEGLTTSFVGTLRYSSPQQVAHARSVDHRTDIYSVGATLWEMLTLQPMFGDTSNEFTPEMITNIISREPDRPRRHNPRVPSALEAIVLKCLEKDPDDRYQTAQELADDLKRWQTGQPVHAKLRSPVYRVGKFLQRHWLAVGTAVVVLYALLTTVAGIAVYQARIDAVVSRNKALFEKSVAEDALQKADDERMAADKARGEAKLAEARSNRLATAMIVRDGMEAATNEGPAAALPYFARALELDSRQGADVQPHRLRLISALGQLPQLETLFVLPVAVTQAEIGGNGKVLVTLDGVGHLSLWNTTNARPLAVLPAGPFGVERAAISPDGRYLATASPEGDVALWPLPIAEDTLREPPVLEAPSSVARHQNTVTWLTFSPNGRYLASAGLDGLVCVAPVAPPGQRGSREFSVDNTQALHVTFSPDSQSIAISFNDGLVRLWNVVTGEQKKWVVEQPVEATPDSDAGAGGVRGEAANPGSENSQASRAPSEKHQQVLKKITLDGLKHPSAVRYAAFSPDGKRLITADGLTLESMSEHVVNVWNLETGSATTLFESDYRAFAFAVFSPDGQEALAVDDSGVIESKSLIEGLTAISGSRAYRAPFAPVYRPDGRYIAHVNGNDLFLTGRGSDPDAPRLPHTAPIKHVWFSADCERLTTICEDGTLRVLRMGSTQAVEAPSIDLVIGGAMGLSRDGRRALVSLVDKQSAVVDVLTGQPLSAGWRPAGESHFSPSGNFAATREGELWDVQRNQVHVIPRSHQLLFDEDDRLLILFAHPSADDRTTIQWDLTAGTVAATEKSLAWGNEVDADTSLCRLFSSARMRATSLVSGYGTIAVQNLFDGEFLGKQIEFSSYVTRAELSPNERHVAVVTEDYTVHLADTVTGKVLGIAKQSRETELLRFSPSGKRLLIVNEHGYPYVASVPDCRPLTTTLVHPLRITHAAFLDEDCISTVTEDGSIRVWNLDGEDLAEETLLRTASLQGMSRIGEEGIPDRLPLAQMANMGGQLPAMVAPTPSELRAARELRECLAENSLAAALWWTDRLLDHQPTQGLRSRRALLLADLNDEAEALRQVEEIADAAPLHALIAAKIIERHLKPVENRLNGDTFWDEAEFVQCEQALLDAASRLGSLEASANEPSLGEYVARVWSRLALAHFTAPAIHGRHSPQSVFEKYLAFLQAIDTPVASRAELALAAAEEWDYRGRTAAEDDRHADSELAFDHVHRLQDYVLSLLDLPAEAQNSLIAFVEQRAEWLKGRNRRIDLEASCDARQLVVKLYREQAAANQSAGVLRTLIDSLHKLAQVQVDLDRATDAETVWKEALSKDKLLIELPDATTDDRLLPATHWHFLADLYKNQKKAPEALAAFEQAIQIRRALLDSGEAPERRAELASLFASVGNACIALKDLPRSHQYWQLALLEYQRLQADDHSNNAWPGRVAYVYEWLSDVDNRLGRFASSVEFAEHAVAERQRLYQAALETDDEEARAEALSTYAVALFWSGYMLFDAGQIELATERYRTYESLYDLLPTDPEAAQAQSDVLDHLSDFYEDAQRGTLARDFAQRLVARWKDLRSETDSAARKRELADALMSAGRIERKFGEGFELPQQNYDQSLELSHELFGDWSKREDADRVLGSREGLFLLSLKHADWESALNHVQQAQEFLSEIPPSPDWAQWLEEKTEQWQTWHRVAELMPTAVMNADALRDEPVEVERQLRWWRARAAALAGKPEAAIAELKTYFERHKSSEPGPGKASFQLAEDFSELIPSVALGRPADTLSPAERTVVEEISTQALQALTAAWTEGYRDFNELVYSSPLDPIRLDPRYRQWIDSLKDPPVPEVGSTEATTAVNSTLRP